MTNNYAIILAGGSGSRLWPLSRTLRPKQLLALDGEQTLLQQTACRLLKHVDASCLLTVTHQDHKFEVKGQLAEVDARLPATVLAEPCARNTLPAIAWAVWEIFKQDPEAMIGVFPSDHAISDEHSFLAAWQAAELAAAQGYLVLLGITPTEPATGYGYIQPGNALDITSAKPVLQVSRFVEKPDLAKAQQFVDGGYLWNSGMFVFRASVFMQLLARHQPDIHQAMTSAQSDGVAAFYAQLPNLSIDYGLAEKAEQVAVVPVAMGWSDLGSWDSIYQHRDKDEAGNVSQGDVLMQDTQDSLLWNSHGLLATLGVRNIAVIQTADATLVCDRSRTEDIKQLVALVQNSHPQLTETHTTVHRPWGIYRVLEEGPNFKIKCIVVNPGAKLSMQMHKHRSEHWVVVSGTAKITNGTQDIELEANQSTYIPKTHRHRLENPGQLPLQIIEVQCGDYVGEDDIVRFDDSYDRT
ncbi:MAG: mannose-1-phosphate guanylyltransferase/mannose-6-phosphate isomerase [Methylobacter sp.]|nr:mannose-1-phosphate guanylyltransferase/mannose-6-phosphate isomerase [Methylobacter sp.]MDP2430061.1 mannose-1-phosphate guanylyltransferase/mannose-6-phosphate isomerase [Methylobacter sp.]MDP3056876.1 mannose-1-phosphate guanylyltransferase/mannose-6-phosphate isomerase [Methylobacter sp.]MDP3364371.1 mannose-1-phosphate guanylyltransferase/mannose-6-phosphate isomerase [Methylobacter sp.]MDZ4221085.1 mannose-1-phosphate guanylyltransferase/mannose-6-phosphate isomerase [Methylobacter sp.